MEKDLEGGTGSRHPKLGDVGRSPYLNFLLIGKIIERRVPYYRNSS